MAFLPGWASLAGTSIDLGASLILAFRCAARVGAIFGIDLQREDGLRFITDSFTLGCSSNDGEGLLAYLTGRHQRVVTAVSVGGVAYGSSHLAHYLWTSGSTRQAAAGKVVQQTARIVGYELTNKQAARVAPIAGAVLAGMNAYCFVKEIRDAALHIAARNVLEAKVGEQ